MARPIICRSKESKQCYDGFPDQPLYEGGQEEDGTFDGMSVICDACYIRIGQPSRTDPAFKTGKRPASDMGRADGLGA